MSGRSIRHCGDRTSFRDIVENNSNDFAPLVTTRHSTHGRINHSLKLIRGSIDQVDGKASINWVQPRVLSREQIGSLAKRLQVWNDKLHGVEERIAPELLVSA